MPNAECERCVELLEELLSFQETSAEIEKEYELQITDLTALVKKLESQSDSSLAKITEMQVRYTKLDKDYEILNDQYKELDVLYKKTKFKLVDLEDNNDHLENNLRIIEIDKNDALSNYEKAMEELIIIKSTANIETSNNLETSKRVTSRSYSNLTNADNEILLENDNKHETPQGFCNKNLFDKFDNILKSPTSRSAANNFNDNRTSDGTYDDLKHELYIKNNEEMYKTQSKQNSPSKKVYLDINYQFPKNQDKFNLTLESGSQLLNLTKPSNIDISAGKYNSVQKTTASKGYGLSSMGNRYKMRAARLNGQSFFDQSRNGKSEKSQNYSINNNSVEHNIYKKPKNIPPHYKKDAYNTKVDETQEIFNKLKTMRANSILSFRCKKSPRDSNSRGMNSRAFLLDKKKVNRMGLKKNTNSDNAKKTIQKNPTVNSKKSNCQSPSKYAYDTQVNSLTNSRIKK